MINEEKADTSPKNAEDQLAIDITTAKPVLDFLSQFQKQSPAKKKKQNPLGRIMSALRLSRASSIAEEESKGGFRDPSTVYFNDELVAANGGRRTIDIRNSEHR